MSLPMSDATSLQARATDADAADTTNADGKLRKRLQNRLNQRTHRARMKKSGPAGSTKRQRPYETDCWRLDEVGITASAVSLPHQIAHCVGNSIRIKASKVNNSCFTSRIDVTNQTLGEDDVEVYGQQLQVLSVSVGTEPCLWPPPPLANHLLHLVNYNVFRGFFANKSALSRVTTHIIQRPDRSQVVNIMEALPRHTIIVPTGSNIPRHLVPTALQTQKSHATWIDFIPFPRIRDNLIAQEDQFDHREFMADVIGDVMDKLLFSNRKSTVDPQGSSHLVLGDGLDNGMTANRNGLVLWGEPHNPKSWEATPGFLRKWGWTVDGCDELIKSSNHWRMLRGEEMMQFST